MKRLTLFFTLLSMTFLLSACTTAKTSGTFSGTDSLAQEENTGTTQTETIVQTQEPAKKPETVAQTQESAKITETDSGSAKVTGTLYIGTTDGFKEYPFTDEKTPDNLIAAIAKLTGWNLSLADAVTDGKGGMTVCFTKDCSIFTGPPAQQKDEFFAYDNISLARMILDSIQKTLQENYVDRELGGDPSNLDIYFCTIVDGNITDIAIPEERMSVPMDYPYQGVVIE